MPAEDELALSVSDDDSGGKFKSTGRSRRLLLLLLEIPSIAPPDAVGASPLLCFPLGAVPSYFLGSRVAAFPPDAVCTVAAECLPGVELLFAPVADVLSSAALSPSPIAGARSPRPLARTRSARTAGPPRATSAAGGISYGRAGDVAMVRSAGGDGVPTKDGVDGVGLLEAGRVVAIVITAQRHQNGGHAQWSLELDGPMTKLYSFKAFCIQ